MSYRLRSRHSQRRPWSRRRQEEARAVEWKTKTGLDLTAEWNQSEAVSKSKATFEFVKAISRVAKAEAGRTKAACGAKELIREKQQRLSVDQKLP